MLNRRSLLQSVGFGALGLSLPQLLRAEGTRGGGAADSCIIVFLNGGPSHLDMWDMKPEATAEIRGEFRPIASSLDGLSVCEHLPRLATTMHRGTLVRSMHHSVNNSHAAAVYAAMTGHDRGEQGGGAKPSDNPSPGSVLAHLYGAGSGELPYVALPYKTKEGAGGPLQPGFLGGFIGGAHDPFWVVDDPSRPDFRVRNLSLPGEVSVERARSRSELLGAVDRGLPAGIDGTLDVTSEFRRKAFDLVTTGAARKAFELDTESAATRDRYGRNVYGQSVLLARRLIEAGTRMVTISWAPDANATWDTHGQNFAKLKNTLLPQFDAACSSLVEDLADRGRLERTLVAVLGDFGRTPKINGNAGRDHWNACYSILLFGGGVKAGYVHGASDRMGATPIAGPVTPGDVVATLYSLMGVDPAYELRDPLDRPRRVVPEARILREIKA